MTRVDDNRSTSRLRRLLPVMIVFVAAVVMGLPTLGGSFVGGDDHRLALNHVLVNHPSFSHAVELFTIVHRDLYQPLPLLSFSAEFAVANVFGLFEESVAGGAWLFHLTNILLHALNAVLVYAVIVRLHERADGNAPHAKQDAGTALSMDGGNAARAVATVAALLFAVHPLQTEVVAWTNGRMMLMSTLFTLLSLWWFAAFLDKPTARSVVLTIVFVLLSAISKVRIGLPLLLVIVAFARRSKLGWRFIALWVVCSLVTGIFVLVNVWATAGASLFSEAAEHLQGPRMVRVLLALGCYFQHVVWPVGLASYYPTPPLVQWSDAGTWRAVAVVVPSLLILAWACRRSRAAWLGVLWFFVTIASTLPFVPARNILAADRYMYLPIIGLLWLIAALSWEVYRRWMARLSWSRAVPVLAAALIVPTCFGISWYVADFYSTPIKKTTRIATLFSDTPRVWERLGWTLYGKGDYTEAIKCANKELRYDAPNVQSGAYQLLGMSELRRGNGETALKLLHKSLEVNPGNNLGLYRLATAYDDLGRNAEAVTYFEDAVEAAPLHNPRIIRLAMVYRRLGRPADARAMYEKALTNNPYDVAATMGLAELDIQEGTRESYRSAERLLIDLLGWMPENTDALTNLGVVHRVLGHTSEAVEAYIGVLERNPNHVTAALNLAQIYYSTGDIGRAFPFFERVAASGPESLQQAIDVHDFFVAQGIVDRCVSLWERFLARFPGSADGRSFLSWSCALADDLQRARTEAKALVDGRSESPLPTATLAYLDLVEGRYTDATARIEVLCEMGEKGAAVRRRLRGALERYDQRQPDVPWTFCLAARLLIADGNLEGAELFLGLCNERCTNPACHEQVRVLRTQLQNSKSTPSDIPALP